MTKAMKAIAAALARRRHDERGIALQTIIIIVVLLAIAGSVATVLFQRASDVTQELASTDITVGINSAAECTNYKMGTVSGSHSGTSCTWTGSTTRAANVEDANVTPTRCSGAINAQRQGGEMSGALGTANVARVCTLNDVPA